MHKKLKKALSILVSAVTMTSLFPSVRGQNYPYQLDFSASQKKDEYELSMIISKQDKEAGSGLAFIGLYGENQRLIQTFSTSVSATDKTAQKMTVTTNIPSGETVLEARAYVWDSYNGMQPIAEPVTVTKIPQTPTDPTEPSDPSDIPTDLPHLAFLSEIGIMSAGHEEQNLTRGEAAEIAVKILKHQRFAAALEDSADFADIDAGTALCGYVQYCVQNGYLAADGDTFRPDSAITYGDLIKMLVDLLGYKEYAEARGGWITGYLDVAEDLGILLDSAAMSAYVTRAEAAEMFYQSGLAPIVMVTGYYTENGVSYPLKSIMDGMQDRDFESWLTKYQKIYYVEGYVRETNRINSTRCNPDEVGFEIQYTQNYDNSNVVIHRGDRYDSFVSDTMKIGKTNADQQLMIYSSALVQLDSDGNATLLSLTPSNKVTIKELNASLVDDEDYHLSTNGYGDYYLRFYPSVDASKSTKYMLEKSLDDIHLYVNGVNVDSTSENFGKYIIDNTIGTVRLIDSYSAYSTTNGYYDIIMVDYYGTATVGDVAESTKKIIFSKYLPNQPSSLSLDTEENDELTYRIYLNGKRIELADLQPGDILSIAYDVNSLFEQSCFYDIYVSRNTVTGKYTSFDTDTWQIYIDQKGYYTAEDFETVRSGISLGNQYTFYLDAFDRIFDYKLCYSIDYAQYAVIDRYTKSSADDYYRATLYHADGTSDSPQIDTSKVKSFDSSTDVDQALMNYVYVNGTYPKKNPVQNRIVKVKYSNATGSVISIEPVTIMRTALDTPFRSSNQTIGFIRLGSVSHIIDAVSYSDASGGSIRDFRLADISQLESGETYTAYAYGEPDDDGNYPIVLVTAATGNFGVIPEEDPDTLAPQYGVIDKYTKASKDDFYKAYLYKTDGSTESLQVDTSKVFRFNGSTDVDDQLLNTVYQGGTINNSNKTDISGRFVEYKVSPTSGNIIALKLIPATESVGNGIFTASSQTVGAIRLNQNTKLINAAIYCDNTFGYTSDLCTVSLDQLEDQESYTVYVYGEKSEEDGAYPYAILTAATGTLAQEPEEPEEDLDTIEAHYAVIDRYSKVSSADDFYKATLFCDDGQERILEVDPYRCRLNGISGIGINDELENLVYTNASTYTKAPLNDRVVTYKLSPSTGKLLSIDPIPSTLDSGRYQADEKKIATVKLNDSTKILNAISYFDEYAPTTADLSMVTVDDLVDQIGYTIYTCGSPDENGVYPFVMLAYGERYPVQLTQIAILTAPLSYSAENNDCYLVKALYGMEEVTFTTTDYLSVYQGENMEIDPANLQKNDLVAFSFNSQGEIREITKILGENDIGLSYGYEEVRQNAENNKTLFAIRTPYGVGWTTEWSSHFDRTANMAHFVYGPILEKHSSSFTLGTYTDDLKTNLYNSIDQCSSSIQSDSGRGGTLEIYLTDKTNVYVYDYSATTKNRLTVGTKSDIMTSYIPSYAMTDNTINWSDVGDSVVNFAFAKVIDGDATDVFVILAE